MRAINTEEISLWEAVQALLKEKISKPSFETWIAPLKLNCVQDNVVLLTTDSEFNRDWVLKHYRCQLAELFTARLGRSVEIQIDLANVAHNADTLPPLSEITDEDTTSGVQQQSLFDLGHSANNPRPWTPRTVQSNLNPRYTFDQFVVGQHNRFCHAAALAVAETPAQNYNPFFIYGGVGLGKTHLMQAIGHFVMSNHPQMQVRYVTAEQFTNELIGALTSKNMKAFRDRYRKNDVLIIDDIQFLEGKERTQEEVFHTFNALHESGKQVILSSDRSPRYLSALEERLKSRFEWGLIADIQPADYETRLAILQNKGKREHLSVPDDILSWIAESYPNNIRELEGAFNKISAYSMLTKTILDLDIAKAVLGCQPDQAQVSVQKILETVASYYHLRASDLKSPSRSKDVSHARQVAIYVVRNLTEASFPKIGDALGGRKHTTILYAYEKIKEELDRHPVLGQQIKEITGRVKMP